LCADPEAKLNPGQLGFIPVCFWPDEVCTFGHLVSSFFRAKTCSNSRFLHKLFNALRITDSDPYYAVFLGVRWVTDKVIKIDKTKFANLLGIRSVNGSLFNQQGNFPSHGFRELAPGQASQWVSPAGLEDVDFENVRLLIHRSGEFTRGCGPDVEERCRWVNFGRRY
jgi:hypothetical protein